MRVRTYLLISVGFISLFAAPTDARSLPNAMAVLGDSMSEGMLAGYSLENKPPIASLAKVLWLASRTDHDGRILIYREKLARPDLSWATGNSSRGFVQSHFLRLKKLNPSLTAQNFAVSGSESNHLHSQVDRFLDAEDKGSEIFDYVILMIGANDLAFEVSEDITPAVKYLGNIEAALRRILDKNPNRAVLAIGLPDIHTIFEKSANYSVYKFWGESLKCQAMRRQVYGNKTVFFPENKDAYEYTKTILSQYRTGLGNLVERLQTDYPSAELKFIKDYRLPTNIKKALSIDCFHPSEWGQAELAEMTWEHGFWSDLQDPISLAWGK